jgi:hypothetical protein
MIASNVLDSLTQPGRLLAFCDDTDISDSPLSRPAPHLRILCAVVMTSERYAVASPKLKNKLKSLGQAEFHATEIVNPKASSQWKQVPIEERLKALQFLGARLVRSTTKLYYAHVSRGQYEQLREAAEKFGSVNMGYKAGLKRVFLSCLFDRLGPDGAKAIVILDQDKALVTPVVGSCDGGEFLCGGGPIAADSTSILGLQLADMAAFSIGRYLRKRALGSNKAFDITAIRTIAGLAGRCENLLSKAA